MKSMSDHVALVFLALGFGFSTWGLYLSGKAFLITWSEYGDEPLLPWVMKFRSKMTNLVHRLTPWRKRESSVLAVAGSAHAHAGVSARVVGRAGFPERGTDRELVETLIAAVEGIYAELNENRLITQEAVAGLGCRLDDVQLHLVTETSRLEALSKRVATGDVRTQLAGLLCIAIGTVLSAFPAIWDAIASIA